MAETPEISNLPSTSNEEGPAGILATFGEWFSGIPKVFQKPLAKAISRLALSAVEWPATALEAKAADVKHNQEMREKIRAAMVKQAISQIPEKSDIADRALEHFAADILGKQHNREQVLLHAAEELSQIPPSGNSNNSNPEGKELDDDWLAVLARYAENATSERLQQMFGRVLAGEIKRPGAYSLFTLDLISKIGEKDAKAITTIAPYVIGDGIYLTPTTEKALDFAATSHLIDIGILNPTSIGTLPAMKELNFNRDTIVDDQPCLAFAIQRHVLLLLSSVEQKVRLKSAVLTWVGQEVFSLHSTELSGEMLKELAGIFKEKGVAVKVADLVSLNGNTVTWRNARLISP